MNKTLLWGVLLCSSIACTQVSPPNSPENSVQIIGSLGIDIGENAITNRAQSITDQSITLTTTQTGTFDTNGNRYMYSRFKVRNNTNAAFKNLTFYAVHQRNSVNTPIGVAGTAFKNVHNAGNQSIINAGVVRSITPAHAVTLNAGQLVQIENASDFQAFTRSEVAIIKTEALNLGTIGSNDQILEFGFVARNLTGGRSIAAGQDGQVTVAFKIPLNPDANLYPSGFTMNAVVADVGVGRVTRGELETTAQAQTRASLMGGINELALLNSDDVTTWTKIYRPKLKLWYDQPTALAFSAIDPNLEVMGPGRGAEQWSGVWGVNIPSDTSTQKPFNVYERSSFQWSALETALGVYNWTLFDQKINAAIDNNQKFSFGIMTVCPSCDSGFVKILTGNFNGNVPIAANASYPQYLHDMMQNETVKDWVTPLSNVWSPNWNSPSYLERFKQLLIAINNRINTKSHPTKGILYKNAIDYIDVRGYGAYGEWHVGDIAGDATAAHNPTWNPQPPGVEATPQTLKGIIDTHVAAFPDFPLVALMGAIDGGSNEVHIYEVPAEVAYHALTVQNSRGLLGWRRDNFGSEEAYIANSLDKNKIEYFDPKKGKTVKLKDLITERWRVARVLGEPMDIGYKNPATNNCEYDYFEQQVQFYHVTSFGNGNYQTPNILQQACVRKNIQAASRASGYRYVLNSGAYSISSTRDLIIDLEWSNKGVAPTYNDWLVTFELRQPNVVKCSGGVAWSSMAQDINLKTLLPETPAVSNWETEILKLPSILASGTYELCIVIKDPLDYMKPLPLAITGRNNTTGAYLIAASVQIP